MILQPKLVKSSKTKMFLTEDFNLIFEIYNILIKAGAETDGDSIPTITLRFLINKKFNKLCLAAALVHDMLYATRLVSREEADQIYYKILILSGYNKYKAKIKYLALRACGWYRWNESTPASIEHAMLYIRFSKGTVEA